MGGGQIDPKYVRAAAAFVFIAFVACVLLPLAIASSWLALLLSFAGITHWPSPPAKDVLLTYFFISFTILCASLWLGAQVGVVKLQESAQKTIGRVFVVAALAAVVSMFKKMTH